MSINDFLRELESLPCSWRYYKDREAIRGNYQGYIVCPLTAVFLKRTGRRLPSIAYQDVGSALGFSEEQSEAIANIVDYPNKFKERNLRRRLFQAMHIQYLGNF